MKFFLDTNILIDLFLRRNPHFEVVTQIFNQATLSKIEVFVSSHCVATTHYVCKKNMDEDTIRNLLDHVLEFVNVIAVDEEILKKSLKSQHKDFEDAIQIFCAHQIKNLDGIITRNLKDFSTSEISVFAPDEVLNLIEKG